MVLIHVAMATLPPHPRYPDLASMIVVVYAAAHFIAFHLAFLLNQWAIDPQLTEDQHLRAGRVGVKNKGQ